MKELNTQDCCLISGATQYLVISSKAKVEGIPRECFEQVLAKNVTNMTFDQFERAAFDIFRSMHPMPSYHVSVDIDELSCELVEE